jgi:hypothetical protein
MTYMGRMPLITDTSAVTLAIALPAPAAQVRKKNARTTFVSAICSAETLCALLNKDAPFMTDEEELSTALQPLVYSSYNRANHR